MKFYNGFLLTGKTLKPQYKQFNFLTLNKYLLICDKTHIPVELRNLKLCVFGIRYAVTHGVNPLLEPVTSVCVSRDGQCTLASCLDSTLRLMDKDSGELLNE